jgi:hypothetical protein
MCPLYVAGLIGPGDRKSVAPMAERLGAGNYDQLHHFVAAGVWDSAPVETELLVQADKLVGGSDAVLVIDDTAMSKKGRHSYQSLKFRLLRRFTDQFGSDSTWRTKEVRHAGSGAVAGGFWCGAAAGLGEEDKRRPAGAAASGTCGDL